MLKKFRGFVFVVFFGTAVFSWSDLQDFANPGASVSAASVSFIGEDIQDNSGSSVAANGDVDGDGLSDILIGAPQNADGGTYAGQTYLFLGANLDGSSSVDLSAADYFLIGDNGFSGTAVAFAGDVDGDGLDDILVGASQYDWSDIGIVYLILGSSLGSSRTINLSAADYSFSGENFQDFCGSSIAGAGDVDHDGLDDIVIGVEANDEGGGWAGKVYVILGSSLGSSSSIDLSAADIAIVGNEDYGYFGSAVAGLGDIDRDGDDDIMIGADGCDGSGTDRGAVYVFSGSGLSSSMDDNDADYILSGEDDDDEAGSAVASAGDVDDDGRNDLLIGAPGYADYTGKAYVILSSSLASMNLEDADYVITGEDTDEHFGDAVASAGDVDQDGRDDLLVGAYLNRDVGASAGKGYLFLASSLGSSPMRAANADYAFLAEASGDYCGTAVASGDVNGNGISDILIGASANNDGGSDAGQTYLILSGHCTATNIVYVDSFLGADGASGGVDCPLAKIQDGINLADSLSITQVVVRGGAYYETVTMAEDIQLIGETRLWWPVYIIATNYDDEYLLYGANRASVKYCVLVSTNSNNGGVLLDGVNEMVMEENVVIVRDNGGQLGWITPPALHLDGASDNRFENNVFYAAIYNPTQAVVVLEQNSDDNVFINNVMHRLGYRDLWTIYGLNACVVRMARYTEDNEFRNNILHSTRVVASGRTNSMAYTQWYGFYADSTADTTYTIEYNKTGSNNYQVTLGTGCLATNKAPMFTNAAPEGFDYHLMSTSPCRNRGTPGAVYLDPDGSRNDMGVYGGPNSIDFLP